MMMARDDEEDVLRIPLIDLEAAVERAFSSGLTPLVLDCTPEDQVCTFYSYQTSATLLEAKQLVLAGSRRDRDRDRESDQVAELEPLRRSLVNAMKYGKLLVVRLANAAPSLFCKWNDEALGHDNSLRGSAYFPQDVFFEGGKRIRDNTELHYRLFRDADMFPNKNIAYCRDEFRVCFTSQFRLEDVDEYLFQSQALPPRENFKIIIIEPDNDE